MTVKLFRLISGEEILADYNEMQDYDNRVILKNPVRIIMTPPVAQGGSPGVQFAPFNPFSGDKSIDIHNAHIVFSSVPIREFVNQYNSLFGGIELPPASKLILPT